MNRHEEMLIDYSINKKIILKDYANKHNLLMLTKYTASKAKK